MTIIGNPLLLGGGGSAPASGVVYITDELDEHGGIVRHLTTDGATITDTTDSHGGTVRSITGAEVRLQVKRVTPGPTEQVIEADAGYGALAKVIVEAAEPSGDSWEEYIPETTIAASDFQDYSEYGWEFEGHIADPIETGATYKVVFDGVEYTLTGQEDSEIAPALGDLDFSFADYPFHLYSWEDALGNWYWQLAVPSQPNQTQTIEVYKKVEAAKPMMIVEIEDINGTPTADHTFEEIFNAVNGGTPVFLHIPAESGDDWAEESVDSAQFLPVVRAYKYVNMYRIAATSTRRYPLDYSAAYGYVFAPALYNMQASDIDDYPTFLRYVYPTTSTIDLS